MNLPRLMLCLALAGCGVGTSPSTPSEPTDEIAPVSAVDAQAEPAHARVEVQGPAPFLSRYAPTRGVIGTHLRILGTFSADPAENVVTVGGVVATPVPNDFWLEVTIPYGAVTGPLCVTVRGQSACGETFTLLDAPVITLASPDAMRSGTEAKFQIFGDGFLTGSVALLDGYPLETSIDTYGTLEATLPASATPGVHALSVKNGLRCGAESVPVPVTLH